MFLGNFLDEKMKSKKDGKANKIIQKIKSLKNIGDNIFGNIVYEHKGKRSIVIMHRYGNDVLMVNNVPFSLIRHRSIFVGGYWDYFILLPFLYKYPKVLLIGLGGGTIIYQMKKIFDKIDITAVENDPEMVEAKNHFLPEKVDFKLKIGDGAEFVNKTNEKYNLIIFDAYDNYNIPEIFLKESFLNDVYDKLDENGIFAVNYIPIEHNEPLIKMNNSKKFTIYQIDIKESANKLLLFSKNLKKKDMLNLINTGIKNNVFIKEYIIDAYKSMKNES